MLLCWNRYCPADCFGEARLDPRFDVSANGAESFGLELGKLVADSADLFDRAPLEETQTHIGHYRPSGEDGEYVENRTFNPDAGRASQENQLVASWIASPCWDSLTNQWVK